MDRVADCVGSAKGIDQIPMNTACRYLNFARFPQVCHGPQWACIRLLPRNPLLRARQQGVTFGFNERKDTLRVGLAMTVAAFLLGEAKGINSLYFDRQKCGPRCQHTWSLVKRAEAT